MTLGGQERVLAEWLAAGGSAAAEVPDAARRASLAAFLAESASLAPQIMLYTLRRSGFSEVAGWQVVARGRELRVAPCFTPLLQRWHLLLEEEGWLECEGDCWRLAGHAPEPWALEQRIDDAIHRLSQLMSWLDESSALATALFSGLAQLDEWLVAPVLLPHSPLGLDLLLHVPGILDDYFSGIVASMVPLLQAEPGDCQPLLVGCQRTLAFGRCVLPVSGTGVAVDLRRSLAAQLLPGSRYAGGLFSGLLSEAAAPRLLAELRDWLKPGAPLLLLENSAERPLHWVTPAALRAHAVGDSDCPFSAAADEARCRQQLEQAGYQLLAVWPQPATAMAFCGQRLLLARVARG